MNFKTILTKNFWFYVNPVMLENADKVFALIGVIMVLLAAIFKVAAVLSPTPVDKKYRNRLFRLFLTTGLLELVWYSLRYENVTFLGTHFMAVLLLVIAVVWFVFIVKDMVTGYKGEKETWEKEQVKLKYLPNSSK